MSIPTISPAEAKRLLDQGAALIDIRGRDEHARERIEGARNLPVESLTTLEGDNRIAIFHCRSGQRTATHAAKLAEAASCEAYIVEGGIEAWKKAGLPVARDRSQPIEIQRQVMIAAGSLVLLGVLLGRFVAPELLGSRASARPRRTSPSSRARRPSRSARKAGTRPWP